MLIDLKAVDSQELPERFNSTEKNHYRLCSYLADQYQNALILDLGTSEGASALAFAAHAQERRNSVVSVDVEDRRELDFKDLPIEFITADASSPAILALTREARVILIDIDHRGTKERIILEHLRRIHYDGIVVLDDIHLFGPWHPLSALWKTISEDKYDLTQYCHQGAGTGLIDFSRQVNIVNPVVRKSKESRLTRRAQKINYSLSLVYRNLKSHELS